MEIILSAVVMSAQLIVVGTDLGTPAEKKLTAEDARLCVTGYDYNRPDPFPGLGDFIGWAEAIERMPNGDILLVHSAGYGHVSFASPRQLAGGAVDFEAPTGGRSMACRSNDNGKTWSKPVTVVDHRLDDRPDGLFVCRDGTVLCFVNVNASWSGYQKAPAGFENDIDGLNSKQFVVRSKDNGRTWSSPIWIDSPGAFYERAHGRPIQLDDGAILWATYCENVGGAESGGKEPLFGAIHRSTDSGKTWKTISTIHRDGLDVDEPAIAELKDGRLIMVTRPDGGVLYSKDRGVTWIDSGKTVKKHGPTFRAPQLFVLQDGTVVALATWHVFGFGGDLPYLCAWISKDSGMTWSEGIPLDTSCYGYPGGFMMKDESIMVSYCESAQAPNRVYVIRIRVNAVRDDIEFLPINEPIKTNMTKATMDIVVNEKATCTIVIPDEPLEVVEYAARELQYHIKESTGATLPVLSESTEADSGSFIYLGSCRKTAKAGISMDEIAANGFRIKLIGSDLFMCGRDSGGHPVSTAGISVGPLVQAGTLFAVYGFLTEQVGVRWLWPGKLGEVIPKRRTIRVSHWDQTWQPPLVHTRIRTHVNYNTGEAGWPSSEARNRFLTEQSAWLRRHRFGRAVGLDYPHAFTGYWERYGETHPEFFNLLPNGERVGDPHYWGGAGNVISMCVSQPGFWKQIVANWQESRSSLHPWINLCENDVPGKCTCPSCRAWDVPAPDDIVSMARVEEGFEKGSGWYRWLGSLSDRYCRFYLAVQKEAQKVDPEATVIGFSYENYAKPPVETKLNERVVISLVPGLMFPWTEEKRQHFREQWQGWAVTGARLYLRPNYTLDGHNLPIFYARKFGEDFSFAFAHGMIATDFDSLTGQYATQGPNLYVLARVQIDGDKPVDELLDEYYQAFGPAGHAVRAYFRHWEEVSDAVTDELLRKNARSALGTDWVKFCDFYQVADAIFTPAVMQQGFALLEEAERASQGDALAQQRVEFLKKGLKNAELTLAVQVGYRHYKKTGDTEAYLQALETLDRYREVIEKDNIANMAYLAWAESRAWDRTLLQVQPLE